MTDIPGDAAWLARRAHLLFRLDAGGRILAVRDPTQTPPRIHLQRSAHAVVVRLRHDLPAGLAGDLERLTAVEPPSPPSARPPACWDAVRARLEPWEREGGGPIYPLPNAVPRHHPGEIVRSGSPAGIARVEDWRSGGFPQSLLDLGFVDADDVWAPFCLLLLDGDIAAVCQSARLTDDAAEVGVITAPDYRGRGLAAAVTAAWSRHPDLAGRTLVYSTSRENRSSQRVAARLGLRQVAEDFSLY